MASIITAGFLSALSPEELAQLESLANDPSPEAEAAIQQLVEQLSAASDGSQVSIGSDGLVIPLDTSQLFKPDPSHKQKILLNARKTPDGIDEVLYGGSLFGGKTVGLIHAALQYVHVPGYHAIFFRKTRQNVMDVIDRLKDQLLPNHARFIGSIRGGRFVFPSGALLDMGYMQYDDDKLNYKGPEYQCIIFDELTEFLETQYTYMFSRLRSASCPYHPAVIDLECQDCKRAGVLNKVPLRCYSGSNPDGKGRAWVRDRFVSTEAMEDIERKEPKDVYQKNSVFFIPSFVKDNPGANAPQFIEQQTKRLNIREQAMLLNGSWKEMKGTLYSDTSFQRYLLQGNTIRALRNGVAFWQTESPGTSYKFATVDVAHTSQDKAREAKGANHSWSVMATWEYYTSHGRMLFLRDVWRDRVETIDLQERIKEIYQQWKHHCVIIEETVGAKLMIEQLQRYGMPVKAFNPSQARFRGGAGGTPGKLERSHAFQMMCKAGEVFIPEQSHDWLITYLLEMTCWTGMDSEVSDQVDVSSMAGIEVEDSGGVMVGEAFDSPASVAFDRHSRDVVGLWSFS